jgi:lysophospholipase L1-like esterase
LVPEGRQEDPRWEKVHHLNVDAIEQIGLNDLDVIFLGDSITEGWSGKLYGTHDPRVQGALPVFQSYFSKRHGGKYEALAQGVSGDTTPALLWRIQNGEIGSKEGGKLIDRKSTQPLIFWVLIGTNDVGRTGVLA